MIGALDVKEPRDGSAPVAIDLNAPGEYRKQIDLAHTIDRFIRAMPLDKMSARADDECDISLLSCNSDASRELRRTRELVALLASTQRQLVKIRTRYGE